MSKSSAMPSSSTVARAVTEITEVSRVLVPNIIIMFVRQFFSRVTLAFMGIYDPLPTHLAFAALGIMYSSVTGNSMGVGLTSALPVFCAQNHGRGKSIENGVVMRQSNKIHAMSFAFALSMAIVSAPLLGALGQPQELLGPVQKFSIVMALSLPGGWLSMSMSMALSTQDRQMPGLVSSIVCGLVSLLCSWAFLAGGMGYMAIAWSMVASSTAQAIYLAVYIRWSGLTDHVWGIPDEVSKEGQVSFKKYLVVALPSALAMWAEWWAANIFAVFAGKLPGGATAVAANGLLFNTLTLFYLAFTGICSTASQRVSFHIGAKDVKGVKMAVSVCISISIFLAVVVSIILSVFGENILRFYTQDEGIIREAMSANMGMVMSIAPYALFMCCLGIMRSCGQQKNATKITWFAFYLIGVPLSFWLGVHGGIGLFDWSPSLLGCWLGNVAGLGVSAVLMTFMLFRTNWEKVIASAAVEARTPKVTCSEATPIACNEKNTQEDSNDNDDDDRLLMIV